MSEENGTGPGTPGEQKSALTDEQLAANKPSSEQATKQNEAISASNDHDEKITLDDANYDDGDNHFLVTLNRAITALIQRDKVINDAKIDIWYDLPENDDKTPDGPTICIYLYDVKENSSMRNGESGSRGYIRNSHTLKLYHGYLHIQCSYLIIFWDKTSQQTIANNQNAIIASRIVTALLDTYHLEKIPEFNHFPDYDARFIQSSEQMNSISNFWQSLKQRPRLCLSYEVTVPVLIPEQTGAKAPMPITKQALDIFASQDKPVNPNVDNSDKPAPIETVNITSKP
ncbi:Pvc16 family protein [Rouxiella sp. WC2420]|uniref:Pvc16 family protein n=1 Tax=Rouxiella sp. WC2420 TaxID=3234145 RepID=A0AB39VXJ7_9GAMM